jgi:hypothetical protein
VVELSSTETICPLKNLWNLFWWVSRWYMVHQLIARCGLAR